MGGINRSISIPMPSISGRIGSGIGQGLAEQLPQEIERNRRAQGLNELSQEKNLTPFEQFARLASVPGITPQMIQSGSELLRHQGIAQGFRNTAQGNPFRDSPQSKPQEKQGNIEINLQQNPSGLVDPKNTKAALEPYIPKNKDQLKARAAELYDQQRQLYPDPRMALEDAVDEDRRNQAINQAQQSARQSQRDVQERLRSELKGLRGEAGSRVPENVYQQVENDVLDQVENGVGELEAAKYGQTKLDEISREYQNVKNLGNWTFPLQKPADAVRSINASRKDFKKRDDLENFADTLVGSVGLSSPKAYHEAYRIEDQPELRKEIDNTFKRFKEGSGYSTNPVTKKESREIFKRLENAMGKEGSPLAVAEELRRRRIDPNIWLNYLNENKDNLSPRQSRELTKTINWFPSLNDLFFYIGTGNEEAIGE